MGNSDPVFQAIRSRQDMERSPARLTSNALLLSCMLILSGVLFRSYLAPVFSLSWKDDRYLQIALAPLLCLFLLYWERSRIFSGAHFSPRTGILSVSAAMLCVLAAVDSGWPADGGSRKAIVMFAIALFWMSAFLLCFGLRSLRKAAFALCCLVLMIPVSPAAMDWMSAQLQSGSAATSFQLLRLLGIPVYREGMTFMLPGLVFKVAPECSGIHSWLAFVVVAILATRVFLKSRLTMVALVALTVPIAIFKNAVRIVLISALTAYVDPSIINGPLHRHGGPLFALIDLAIFIPPLVFSRRMETRRPLCWDSGRDTGAAPNSIVNAAG
jgi:exosortase